MKKSLYEISNEALEIVSALEEGELTPELEEALIINQEELQIKAINYAYVIKDSEHNINAIDEEIARLQDLKKVEVNKQDRLKEAVKQAMNLYGLEKVECPTMKISFRNSESVEIVSMEQIPSDYRKKKVTVSADKTAIKQALKSGKDVPGAVLQKNKNLQIK